MSAVTRSTKARGVIPHSTLQPGVRVRTHTGYLGTVYGPARRAAADIRVASVEIEKDMQPYTVDLDGKGFSTYRGHELDVVS